MLALMTGNKMKSPQFLRRASSKYLERCRYQAVFGPCVWLAEVLEP